METAPNPTNANDDGTGDQTTKKRASTTMYAPGFVPEGTARAASRAAATDGPKDFIFKEMRKATAQKKDITLGARCWHAFWCLVPDVAEHAGARVGKEMLKGTLNTFTILRTLFGDPKRLFQELKAMWQDVLPDDSSKYAYDPELGKLPGRLTSREMIYCARLSLLAYLTRDVSYNDFFPEHREDELVNHIFDEGANQIHQIFLVHYVASLFDQNAFTDDGTTKNPRFGYAKGMASGLSDMNLELVYPFDVNNNEGFIAKSKNFEKEGGDVVIAFQGTVDRQDFITSFHGTTTPFEPLFDGKNAGAMPCLQGRLCGCCLGETEVQKAARSRNKPLGRVHVGFYNAFLSVRDGIQTTLEILLKDVAATDKPVRIVVTGHSLGGALATMCTGWLMQWFRYEFPGGLPANFRVLSVTFGQPKVGDDEFVANIDKDEWTNWTNETHAKFKTYRIFTPFDPVVTTPPVDLGFRHCYAMCLIRDGKLFFLPPSMANKLDTTTQGLRRAIDKGMSILHFHDLFCYLDAVMHFADLTRGDLDMEEVFGAVDYEGDVKAAGFLDSF